MLERDGNVRTTVAPNRSTNVLQTAVRRHLNLGSSIFTDGWDAYRHLRFGFTHYTIDHSQAYVDGILHTNGLENHWSLLKRTIRGTYVAIDACHLGSYLGEQAFRFNHRELKDGGRFEMLVPMTAGRRTMD